VVRPTEAVQSVLTMRYSLNHLSPIRTKSELPRQAWKVNYREVVDGKPTIKSRWFSNQDEAERFCKVKREEVRLAGDGSAYLSKELKLEAIAVSKLLEPTGKSLTEAVEYFLRETDLIKRTSITVKEVAELYLKKLEARGRGVAHRLVMGGFLKMFCEDFGETKIALLKENQVERWLYAKREERKQSPVTFNNHRNYLVIFLNFAVAKKYLTENPAKDIEKIATRKRGQERPDRLLTPEDMRLIIANAPERLKTPIILMGLCGIRLAEVARLKWSNIMLRDNSISITEAVSKTKSSRTVALSDLVSKYLATVEEKDMRKYIYEPKKPEEVRSEDTEKEDFARGKKLKHELRTYKLRLKGLVNWKGNSLRVSAISYTLEKTGNAFETAKQMGNSPEIIDRTYKNLTNKRQAEKWFAIDPLDPKGAYITTGKNQGKALSDSPFPQDWFPQWTRSGDIKNLPRGITYDRRTMEFRGKAKGWSWLPEEGLMPPMSLSD
jgi:integrase